MKILLDECVTKKLKQHLMEFEVKTVVEMNWSGFKNGNLLSVATEEKFDVLLTIDKNLQYQQNMNKYDISVVVLDVEKSKIENLEEILPKFKKQADNFEKGKIYLIEREKFDSDLEH
jgi:predicted nuclease of predicted toxin-antitoxin system